jgi:hypothetical protein
MRTRILAFIAFGALLAACAPSGRSDGDGDSDNSDDPQQCGLGKQECSGECVDTLSDPDNCGGCGNACESGLCAAGSCLERCEPNETGACYDGPSGTQDVGICRAGTRTCSAGGTWGPCEGQVLPGAEDCSNGIDDNCSGQADESVDNDGDGYTTCDGDCCDSTSGCTAPELVNPGAIDVAGNNLDDDCDGTKDNVLATTCDTGLASNSSAAMDYAKAMELCQVADANATGADRKWGVVSARFAFVDGTGQPDAAARSIRPDFGATTVQAGASLAVLSTGTAADTNDTNPSFADFQTGREQSRSSAPPLDWLMANNSNVPNAPGCPDAALTDPLNPFGDPKVHDPIMLELKIRVPSNAKSFTLSSNFLSAEYPEYVCSAFNDFFVVLLDSAYSGTPANPSDKNLAIYKAPGGQVYPVGVNLAYGNTGLFRECKNGPTGCTSDAEDGSTNTCTGTASLVGTGFDRLNPLGYQNPLGGAPAPGYCGESNMLGGGTGWLVTAGNVTGGETITLRIALWDTSDGMFDSIVLLDNFKWSLEAAQPGTVID